LLDVAGGGGAEVQQSNLAFGGGGIFRPSSLTLGYPSEPNANSTLGGHTGNGDYTLWRNNSISTITLYQGSNPMF